MEVGHRPSSAVDRFFQLDEKDKLEIEEAAKRKSTSDEYLQDYLNNQSSEKQNYLKERLGINKEDLQQSSESE